MQNKIIKRLSDEIIESTQNAGGIKEFVKSEENKGKIVNWLGLITDVSALFEEKNGFEMELGLEKYHNCYFKVGSYFGDSNIMYIAVYGIKDNGVDTEDYFIDSVTVFNSKIYYSNGKVTVKEKFVNILKELGIIVDSMTKIFTSDECRNIMDYTDKEFSICTINKEKLKSLSKDWNYLYE